MAKGQSKPPAKKARFTFAWGAVTAGMVCVIGITWRLLMTQGISGPSALPSVFSIFGEAVAILITILVPSFFIGLLFWPFRGYVAPVIALFWAIGTVEEARDSRRFDVSAAVLGQIVADSGSLQEIEWTISRNGLTGGAISIFQELAAQRRSIQAELSRRFPILTHPLLRGPLPDNPSRDLLREAAAVSRRVVAVIPHAARFERQSYQALLGKVEGLALQYGASDEQAHEVAMRAEQAVNRQLMAGAQLYEAAAREAEATALMLDFLVERYGNWRQKSDGSFEFRWSHDANRFRALLLAVEDAKTEIASRVEALEKVSF